MFTILILALLLSCAVVYTNCQQNVLNGDVPSTRERFEASGVNSFKSRSYQIPIQNNPQSRQVFVPQFQPGQNFQPDFIFYANNPGITGLSFSNPNRISVSPQATLQNAQSPGNRVVRPGNGNNSNNFSKPTPAPQTTERPRAPPQDILSLDKSNFIPVTRFAYNLFRISQNEGQNFIACPLSPQLLLSYLVIGSDGKTKEELENAVGFKSPVPLSKIINQMLQSHERRQLQIATAFFISNKYRLGPGFESHARENNVATISTNFNDPDGFNRVYNGWAQKNLGNTFRPARLNPAPNTKMVLSSGVFFKGEWIYKFNPAQPGTFYSAPGAPMAVNMMTLNKKLPYGKLDDQAEWVSIPYNSSDAMVVILPRSNVPIDVLIPNLRIHDVMEALDQDNYANVNLTLPKFKIETRYSLVEPLKRMGIQTVFTPNSELTRLTEGEPVQVSNALQQSSLEVNEEGSIATSVTSFSVVALSFTPPIPDVDFTVNRPFIAMIVNRQANFPYFLAKVVTPQY